MNVTTLKPVADSSATLTCYILDRSGEMPNTAVRPAVLLCPGGAYRVCSDREAEPVAMAFLAEGYHVFILRYSVGVDAVFPKPLVDAEAALALIKGKADEWGIDAEKVAACGFSAGGHLAAALGTMGKIRPNALILGYPCVLEEISKILGGPVPALDTKVHRATPPSFIFATVADELVPVENALAFASALRKAGVPFELHLFQNGAHGLSLAKPVTSAGLAAFENPTASRWFDLCLLWLNGLGWTFKSDADQVSRELATEIDRFSIDVPFVHLWRNPACRRIVLDYIPLRDDDPHLDQMMGVSLRQMQEYTRGTLMDVMRLSELDERLKTVPLTQTEHRNA